MSILIGKQINASPIALGCMRMTRLDIAEAEKLKQTISVRTQRSTLNDLFIVFLLNPSCPKWTSFR